jgi:hypothetical protein
VAPHPGPPPASGGRGGCVSARRLLPAAHAAASPALARRLLPAAHAGRGSAFRGGLSSGAAPQPRAFDHRGRTSACRRHPGPSARSSFLPPPREGGPPAGPEAGSGCLRLHAPHHANPVTAAGTRERFEPLRRRNEPVLPRRWRGVCVQGRLKAETTRPRRRRRPCSERDPHPQLSAISGQPWVSECRGARRADR